MMTMIPFDRYDRAVRRAFDGMDDFFGDFPAIFDTAAGFKMDVEDAGDSYVVSAHLPGVTKDQIDVELNEGRLSIAVDRKETEDEKKRNYLHKETSEWSATRGVYLKDAATAGLTARLADGVLTVTVPKQSAKPNATKIEIE